MGGFTHEIGIHGGGGGGGADASLLSNILSTGLISGGQVTINANPLLFDITAGSGVIVDNYTDPANPTLTKVTWTAKIGVSPPYLLTNTWESIGIDSTGTLVYQADDMFSTIDKRDVIVLGWITHAALTTIETAHTEPIWLPDTVLKLEDFLYAYGNFNISGNQYLPKTGLTIKKTEGVTFNRGLNYENDSKSPNLLDSPAEDPLTFYYYYQSAPGVWVNDNPGTTTIDPQHYDTGAGLQDVTAGYWTIQLMAFYPSMGSSDFQYGQAEYASLIAAKAALHDQILLNPYNSWDSFRGWLLIKEGATDLTDITQAIFINPPRMIITDLETGGTNTAAVITEHNDLNNIQGGQAAERYHLDVAAYNNITAGSFQMSSLMTNYQTTGAYLTTQTVQTQNIIAGASILAGGNTAGVLAAISSGSLMVAGGNNITLSQNGNSITISGPNAGGLQTGISGIAGSAASTVTQGTVQFANLNGISFGLNGNTMTASHNALTTAMASNANTSFIGLNTAQTNITWTVNSSGISLSNPGWLTTAAQSAHSHGNPTLNLTNINGTTASASNGLTLSLSISNYITTAMASNANTSFVGLNTAQTNITWTVNSSGISLSNPGWLTTAAQSAHSHGNPTLNLTNINGTTASASNGLTLSLSISNYLTTARASNDAVGLNTAATNITWTVNSSGISLSNPGWLTTAMQSGANTSFVGAGAAFNGVNATGTINSTGITVSVAAPGAAAENNWHNLSGNVAGTTTISGSTINWVGGNNITLSGLNNSQIRIDAAAGGGGVAVAGSGASTVTSGTMQFANLNGISFGLNGSTMTASHNAITTGMASNQNTSFVNASAAFQGYNASGTIASNGISVSVAAPGGGGGITYPQFEPFMMVNTGTIQSQATLFIAPVSVDQYVTATRVDMIASIAQSVNATLSQRDTISAAIIIYTLSNDSIQLQTISSGSTAYAFSIGSGSSASSVSFTGYRILSVPVNINMTPGLYWIGMWSMTTQSAAGATNNSMAQTLQGVAPRATAWYANDLSISNNSASTTRNQMPGHGYVTVSRSNTNLSLPVRVARSTSAGGTTNADVSFGSRIPYIIMRNFSFPMMSN